MAYFPAPLGSGGIGGTMFRASHLALPLPCLSLSYSINYSSATSMRLSLILSSLHSSIPSRTTHLASVSSWRNKIPVQPASSLTSFTPRWIPSTVVSRTLKERVSFSSGNTGESSKEILVQHLLVGEDNLKLLLELQQRTLAGEDLSDLAVEFSVCPSKENGGMLGWVRRGQMVPEFEDAAFSAPLNKVVRCKTTYGWHLLQVLSEREASVLQYIQPEELHSKMQDPAFFEESQLIDVREPHEVAQASLPGFRVLPLQQFGTWGAEIMNEFDPQKETFVLCHHGMRSLQVAKWLQTQGFKRVFNVTGGIHAYAIKADASVPTY